MNAHIFMPLAGCDREGARLLLLKISVQNVDGAASINESSGELA